MQCESPTKEVVEGAGSGLVSVHLKRVSLSKIFTISRNEQTLGETLPLGSVSKAPDVKHLNTKIQRHD